jgi:3-deoxy-manno-octulosonate cytidylyltransferase (CMP-KDO synthetase)
MKAVGVIPARLGSSRFPGKPLALLLGRTMIEHVYRRTALSASLADTCVATCDNEIREAVEAFGGRAVMTSDSHQRAADRAAEAARHLDAELVVMVQGDEPMTTPDMIDAAVAPFQDDRALQCVNLAKRIDHEAEFDDPNTIKVVMDRDWNALCFSREPIPTRRQVGFAQIRAYKQVCIIPFRRGALLRFAELAPTPLEIAEAIDMMRFLENGIPVRMVETDRHTHAVDTPEDLALVESLMRDDPLVGTY